MAILFFQRDVLRQGHRESGKDINPFYTDLPAVTRDTDYDVVYGLKTDLIT